MTLINHNEVRSLFDQKFDDICGWLLEMRKSFWFPVVDFLVTHKLAPSWCCIACFRVCFCACVAKKHL